MAIIRGPQKLIIRDNEVHFERNVTKEELLFYVKSAFRIYMEHGELDWTEASEIKELFKIYPFTGSIPSMKYILDSAQFHEDSIFYTSSLIDNDKQRIQNILPLVVEYYKFTGEFLFYKTYEKKSLEQYFKPWKNEYKQRLKVLQELVEDYWKSQEE